ncbi:MAG: amidohydrolase family protein [Vitreimonas sp.]
MLRPKRRGGAYLAAALLVTLCAVPELAAQELRPQLDHHTHLWSREASAVMIDPLLPTLDLPEPFAQLIAQRTAPAGASALAELYASDAVFMDIRGPVWIRGRDAIRQFLTGVQPGYRMAPSAFRIAEDAGFIAGTITRGEGEARMHTRSFHLSLVREGGVWRIGAESWSAGPPPTPRALSTDALIAELDDAQIPRAAVFSAAHLFASALEAPRADEQAMVRAENDWLAREIRRLPNRLIGLCSLNPLRDYAPAELRRCVRELGLRGLKLHFADSGVDLADAEHRRRLRAVFRTANALGVPIAAHIDTGRSGYGAPDAAHMLALAASAPDIPIQIAHLAGTGPGLDADEALAVFGVAAAAGDPRMRNLYFDVSSVVVAATSEDDRSRIAVQLRTLGLNRVLFGSDRSGALNEPPGEAWAAFRTLQLTEAEFAIVAGNSLY